eukprot:6432317-Karenia_brevis.AAC.1
MFKTYVQVIEDMRSDPSLQVMAAIDEMDEMLTTIQRDVNVSGTEDKILLVNRSRAYAMDKAF